MKNISAALVLFMPFLLSAQVKHDNTWLFGYTADDTISTGYGGTLVSFNNGTPHSTYFNIPFALDANASISDQSGKLLFYTNGCKILGIDHKEIKNGMEINKGGYYYDQGCLGIVGNQKTYPAGYPTHQGIIILPWPGRASLYCMIHLHKPGPGPYARSVRMTTIDMAQEGGLGMVTEKNKTVMSGDTVVDMMTAVRHGNGRDWWVVLPGYNNGKYHSFLLSPKGLEGPFVQKIGRPVDMWSAGGQAVFSPSGKKYAAAHYSGKNFSPNPVSPSNHQIWVSMYDFDRCTGLLSKSLDTLLSGGGSAVGGVAFSPNSRYLYASCGYNLYQFDMLAEDIIGSEVRVGIFDGAQVPLSTTFYQQMLAPDGKIYMTSSNGSKYLHVIHEPQKAGEACNFEQRGVELFGYHAFSPPNFPYFRLFDAQDTPCDTLGITIAPPQEDTLVKPLPCVAEARLYPNPAISSTWLESPGCQALSVGVYDVLGRHVQDLALPADAVRVPIDVSGWAAGVYMLRLRSAGSSEGKVLPLVVLRR